MGSLLVENEKADQNTFDYWEEGKPSNTNY